MFLSIWFFIIKEQYYSTIGYSWSPSSMSTALLLSPLTVSQFIFDKRNCIIFMKWEKYRMRHCTCRTIFYNLHMHSTTCQHRDHVHAQWTRTIRWDSRRSGTSSWWDLGRVGRLWVFQSAPRGVFRWFLYHNLAYNNSRIYMMIILNSF